ncbi:hypothetical protein L484_019154 [Morus notabilis]|uniref:Uncharacterized protein n=1 Tax=Morus notabilis TaxID=981085 RepID=W9R2B8_9ROSA|nr:hypothetical protein L484_019154 [Morus notabilis]
MEDDAVEGGTGDLSIFVFLMRRVDMRNKVLFEGASVSPSAACAFILRYMRLSKSFKLGYF